MKTSRRALLAASLGLGQLALLERFGLLRDARADTPADAPTKLLSIYLSGGWRPTYYFCPLSPEDIDKAIPAPSDFVGEPVFFDAASLVDLAPGDGKYSPIRIPRTWNDAEPEQWGNGYSPYGRIYQEQQLYEQLSVLHGIDQGTNSHGSGYIAAMCGLAGSSYRAPGLACVAAAFLHGKFGDARPLPCVVLDSRGMPASLDLPAPGSPILVPDPVSVKQLFSTDPANNWWWQGLDQRTQREELDFLGKATGGQIPLTDLEAYALGSIRGARGRTTASTDAVLEKLHGDYASVSKILARDVASVLEKTPGAANLDDYGYHFGANFGQYELKAKMDMSLRLLKSDLASSIHVYFGEEYYDTHSGYLGHVSVAGRQRGAMEVIGRLLSEMKQTPAPSRPGFSLLDDTLVLVFSEFSRTWAGGQSQSQPDSWSYLDDHHPYTSVVFAGGGVAANRQIGNYTVPNGIGVEVDVIEEDGATGKRVPRACDVTATALRILGLDFYDFFIPGGYGEVVGIRAG